MIRTFPIPEDQSTERKTQDLDKSDRATQRYKKSERKSTTAALPVQVPPVMVKTTQAPAAFRVPLSHFFLAVTTCGFLLQCSCACQMAQNRIIITPKTRTCEDLCHSKRIYPQVENPCFLSWQDGLFRQPWEEGRVWVDEGGHQAHAPELPPVPQLHHQLHHPLLHLHHLPLVCNWCAPPLHNSRLHFQGQCVHPLPWTLRQKVLIWCAFTRGSLFQSHFCNPPVNLVHRIGVSIRHDNEN